MSIMGLCKHICSDSSLRKTKLPCRLHSYEAGVRPVALTLASARCPAVRELELKWLWLDQPPAPLARLTLLSLDGCQPHRAAAAGLPRLAAAAPRLRELRVLSCSDDELAAAAEGHPCLRGLTVLGSEAMRLEYEDAWVRAARQLPPLSSLALHLELSELDDDEDGLNPEARVARVVSVCERLDKCERLEHLELGVGGGVVYSRDRGQCTRSMGTRSTASSLLSLPRGTLEAVVDALLRQPSGAGGALHAPRRACRQLRSAANARTRTVSDASAGLCSQWLEAHKAPEAHTVAAVARSRTAQLLRRN